MNRDRYRLLLVVFCCRKFERPRYKMDELLERIGTISEAVTAGLVESAKQSSDWEQFLRNTFDQIPCGGEAELIGDILKGIIK